MIKSPHTLARVISMAPSICSGYRYSFTNKNTLEKSHPLIQDNNPLLDYFQNHKHGHGIEKWEHYFEIYHRHFSRFIGKAVGVMEIGVYSGGSLEMWRSYFGEKSHIYGVDIQEACKVYENDYTKIFIGDQEDRAFWSTVRAASVEEVDIIIDDGGHTPEQQQVTLEEMLSHLRPGGVYLCEDVHGIFNRFSGFAIGLACQLNNFNRIPGPILRSNVSQLQASIHSIHFYPYVVVIEKHSLTPTELSAPKRGTKWQPFV